MVKIHKSIIEMFIQLKNSSKSYKKYSVITKTKQNIKLLKCLYVEGYILGYFFSKTNSTKINVILKYQNNEPLIKTIRFISKPNNIKYCSIKLLVQQKNKNSLIILNTSKGYMSSSEAKLNHVGGMIICQIY